MENYDILETIDLYLNNLLSDEERIDFEKNLASDSQLQQLVEEAKLTNEVVHFANLALLRDQIGSDIKKIKYKDDSKFNPKKLGLLATGLLVVGGISTYYFQKEPKEDSKIEIATDSKSNTNNTITKQEEIVSQNPISPKTETPVESISKSEPKHNTHTTTPEIVQQNTLPTTVQVAETPAPQPSKKDVSKEVNSPISEKEKPLPTPVLCQENFDFKISASCATKATGEILISNKNNIGFTAELNTIDTDKTAYNQFTHLEAGNYELLIRYNESCTTKKTVAISEKWCGLNTSFSFNPDFGEKWELLYEALNEGNYTIYSKSGLEIYSNSFGKGNEYWNGTDKMGNIVPVGTYLVRINYKKGNQETVELTIVR